jgi:diguanylate cyclase (GGDEF)-like protein
MRLTAQTDEGPQVVKCTASIGVATFPSDSSDSALSLVEAADQCLYVAKENGRNQVRQAS